MCGRRTLVSNELGLKSHPRRRVLRVFFYFDVCIYVALDYRLDYIIKIKIHSSCEIENFVETHIYLQAVCDTPIARITVCVSSLV